MSDHAVLVFLCALASCCSLGIFLAAFFIVRVLLVRLRKASFGFWTLADSIRASPGYRETRMQEGFERIAQALSVRDSLTWLLLASVAALMFLPGCAAPGAGMDAVFDAWERVSSDGLVTKEEAAFFAGVMREALGDYGSVDWPTTIVGLLGSAASAFFGVNFYRNSRERKVWGSPPPSAPSLAPTETPAA